MTEPESRYHRQVIFSGLGEEGQRRLAASAVLVVGCGALGGNVANLLARAGVGFLRLVDRDTVALSNLHRQLLFEEADVASGRPKAELAAERLRRFNSEIRIEAQVLEVRPDTVEPLLDGVQLVLDGLDNFEARYAVNDACVRRALPWIYGGILGATAMTLPIFPGRGPCLRCLFPEPPPPGSIPTTATHGVLGPTPAVLGAIEALEAMKILAGSPAVNRELLVLDLWEHSYRRLAVRRAAGCPTCGGR